jgi:hypothetical protein
VGDRLKQTAPGLFCVHIRLIDLWWMGADRIRGHRPLGYSGELDLLKSVISILGSTTSGNAGFRCNTDAKYEQEGDREIKTRAPRDIEGIDIVRPARKPHGRIENGMQE